MVELSSGVTEGVSVLKNRKAPWDADHGRGRSLCRGEGTAAMMGTKLRTFAPQINLSLEELVPQDHF
jgi:hypothetical protein